jgi:hypothetical protein
MSCNYLLGCDNLTRDQLRKYNVTELQGILTELNLPAVGKKHELVDRFYQFWLGLQKPGTAGGPPPQVTVGPTSTVKFVLVSFPEVHFLRARLELFGHISAMLVDPANMACFVTYRNHESAQKLVAASEELGFRDAQFVLEGDLEKRSRELELLPETAQLHNTAHKMFRRTTTEPRIYWAPAPQPADDSP